MLLLFCIKKVYRYFYQVVTSFQYELSRYGINSTIMDEVNLRILDGDIVCIFGAQELADHPDILELLKGRRCILYNLEQLVWGIWDYQFGYGLDIIAIIDYSSLNIARIRKIIGYEQTPIFYIPFGYCKLLETKQQQTVNYYYLLFLGTKNERRNSILAQNNRIVHVQEAYFEGYQNVLEKYNICINIHYMVPSILEIVRIVPLLSNQYIIITERSNDIQLDEILAPYVVFMDDCEKVKDIGWIEEKVKFMRENKTTWFEEFKVNVSYQKFIKDSNFVSFLRGIMETV